MSRLGTFEILEEAGRGGMGVVYRARDPAIGRLVALKVIRLDSVSSDPGEREFLRSRLLREARAAGMLSHPNIVTIYQIGEEGDLAYIAMEFVDGPTLQKLLTSGAPLDTDSVLKLVRQSAEALDYAHSKGIVHRDVKPANLMVGEGATATNCDFGIARMTTGQTATPAGITLGTPHYMAPEQIQSAAVDGRADQYALAAVSYEVLTGHRPHSGDTLPEIFHSILYRQPEPAHLLNPSLPEAVSAALLKGLAKNPADRFPRCVLFAETLAAAFQSRSGKPIMMGPAAAAVEPAAAAPLASSAGVGCDFTKTPARANLASAASRRPVLALAAAFVALATLAGLLYYFRFSAGRSEVRGTEAAPLQTPASASASAQPAPASAAPRQALPLPRLGSSRVAPGPRPPELASGTRPDVPPSQVGQPAGPRGAGFTPSVGAGAAWPMFRGNRQRTGVALVGGPRQPVATWQVQLGGQLRDAPVIGADGTVFIGSTDGRLYAVRGGEVLWSATCGSPLVSAPRIHESGLLSVRVQPNQIRCFHLDGSAAPCPPTLSLVPEPSAESLDGRVFFTEGALLRQLGDSGWRVELGEPASTGPAIAPNGQVLVGTASGVLFAVDERARVRWSYRAPVRITSAPALKADGDVIFGCGDRNLYCVRNGELRWKFATGGPVYSAPVVDRAGVIYFGSADGYLYALSDDGEELWKLNLQNEVRASPGLDDRGRLYVATMGRWLYCISDRTQPR